MLTFILMVAVVALWTPDITTDYLRAKYGPPPSEFLTTASGTEIHYRDQGNRDGTPLVLIHGSNASLHTWEPWIVRLSDDVRLISLDLPGHGLTAATVEDDYTYTGMVAAVKAVADHLGLDRFVMAGNSMGGAVTLSFAEAYPERLAAMILVDSAGARLSQAARSKTDRPLAFRLAADPAFSWIIGTVTPKSLARGGLLKSFHDPDFVTDEMVTRYWELARHKGSRDATGKRFRWYGQAARTIALADIATPALILWGEEDLVIPVEAGRVMHAKLPNSQLIIYPDVGHIPMEEAADRSAGDVRAFLAALKAP